MHFASPLPPWLLLIVVLGIVAVAVMAYRRTMVPVSRGRRIGVATVRGLAMAALVLILARPTIDGPATSSDIVVPILVDVSRSMRVPDGAGGRRRIDEAADRLKTAILPALSRQYKPELYSFGETVATASPEALTADARRSDLNAAIASMKERYRGRPIAGIVVLTDGAETDAGAGSEASGNAALPIYAVGLGSAAGPADREVIGLSAGDPRLDAATVDLKVTAISRGYGREPFQLRVLADGRVLESRRVEPGADGSPVDVQFTVLPDATRPTVYTADIVAAPGETIVENNQRSVLVSPASRKRRILAMEGAPGFDHSFMARALAADPGLEMDVVVRKGMNDANQETYFVQAAGGRAAKLASGFPSTRESLFLYDAVVIANLESDFFTRAQLQLAADFVSERGGGLLVMGGKSFAQRGLISTPLEEVMPVELNDRRGGLARASLDPDRLPKHHLVTLTADGESHSVMRIGGSPVETARLWASMPELATAAQLGGPRPGAQVLAVTSTAGGVIVPLVAVQRYGRGRSMIFTGEGAWRWRMMLPATDHSYEFFWRQAARWLAGAAPEPVSIATPEAPEAGDSATLAVDVRDTAFSPVNDATVSMSLTVPGGESQPLALKRDAGSGGQFSAAFQPERAGLYRVRVDARRGATPVGSADRWLYVGGSDRELTDPRLNEGVLQRLARASGGRYAKPGDLGQLASWLEQSAPAPAAPERRDLWQQPWAFTLLLALLSVEWILRRQWGLR